jgi:hypothetical protein
MHYSIASLSVAEVWSNERIQALNQEVAARFHAENRPSMQAGYSDRTERECEAMPLIPVQMVRVRFRDIGQLPPMNLEDEIGELIDD